jgi:molecular chaperone DnaK (HSP70)
MGKRIGIDLGTTNSVAAFERNGRPEVLQNRAHERFTRSVVSLHPTTKEVLIGTQAWDNAGRNPTNTIFSVKRLMGRFYNDPKVAEVQARYPYQIVKGEGDEVRVVLGEEQLTPTEISAMILRRLKEDAEYRLGEEVTHAVITVPAYFSLNQKQATRQAGELAGLQVPALLTEPSAAAIAYGIDADSTRLRTVLVYDLGGGTFDASVLIFNDRFFNEGGLAGDMWLGGDDFDQALMDYVLREVSRKHQVEGLEKNPQLLAALKQAAEKAKLQLSSSETAEIALMSVVPLADGSRRDIMETISRRQFEQMISRQIDSSLEKVHRAMEKAGCTREDLDLVLLVGGSTAIPLVQARLQAEFGAAKIKRDLNEMEAVAYGAALAATRIRGVVCDQDQEENPEEATHCWKCGAELRPVKRCPVCEAENPLPADQCAHCGYLFREIHPTHVTPLPTGVLADGGVYEIVVPKGTAYPTPEPVTVRFRTASASQRAVLVPFYQAEPEEFDKDDVQQWVGAAHVPLSGQLVPADTPVDVEVNIDRSGCLSIKATVQQGDRPSQSAFIDPRLGRAALEAEGGEEAPEAYSEAEGRLWWSIARGGIAVAKYHWRFSSQGQVDKLQELTEQGRRAAEDHDESLGAEVSARIEQILHDNMSPYLALLTAELVANNTYVPLDTRNEIHSLVRDIGILLPSREKAGEAQAKLEQLEGLLSASVDMMKAEQSKEAARKAGAYLRR